MDKGIRAKIHKTRSLLAVHFVRGHRTVTPWTLRNECARHAWHVDKAPVRTHKNRNAHTDALRSAVLYGLRCELVKASLNLLDNCGGFTNSPHPHKQATRGFNWTQHRLPLSFLGGDFSSYKNILRQREICKTILAHFCNGNMTLSCGVLIFSH